MRSRILLCAMTLVVLGFVGVASADLVVVDHFDNPADALNTSIWTGYGGDSVASSVVTVKGGGGVSWGEIATKRPAYAAVDGMTYEFKVTNFPSEAPCSASGIPPQAEPLMSFRVE